MSLGSTFIQIPAPARCSVSFVNHSYLLVAKADGPADCAFDSILPSKSISPLLSVLPRQSCLDPGRHHAPTR
jgi:hypothetical protein